MEVNQLVFLFFANTGAKIPRKTKQNNENSYPNRILMQKINDSYVQAAYYCAKIAVLL